MEKQDIWDIIQKHLNKTTSLEEDGVLKKWLQEDFENQKLFFELKSHWKISKGNPPDFKLKPAKEKVLKRIRTTQRISINPFKFKSPFGRVSAALLVLIGLTGLGSWWFFSSPISYNIAENSSSKIEKISLPDGSRVWLSAKSTLKYPKLFKENKREVYLEGEAFFEVHHNAKRPFSIYTEDIKTTVLGTSFDINAYPNMENISVTVATGKVLVTNGGQILGKLTRNQKINYHKSSNKFETSTITDPEWNKWKEGPLIFKDSNFGEVTEKLEKRFDVSIKFENKINEQCPVTASFDHDKSLKEVMDMLCLLNNVTYKFITNNQLLISGEGCQQKISEMP